MKAVILAGGKGSRLMPLTADLPKPMMPVLNKPLIDYTVRLLKYYGFWDISVTLQYLPEKITSYLTENFDDYFRFFIEAFPLGTAGSVRAATGDCTQTLLVVSGDALTDVNLADMLEFHRRSGALLTMATKTIDDASRYGSVCTDEHGRITAFREKVAGAKNLPVNCGIYMLEPAVLNMIPRDIFFDFALNLFPEMLEKNLVVCAYPTNDYWCDIGDIKSYYNANMDVLCSGLRFDAFEGVSERSFDKDGSNTDCTKCAAAGTHAAGNYADFETPRASGCVVGKNVFFAPGASARDCVLWDNSFVEGALTRAVKSPDFCISIDDVGVPAKIPESAQVKFSDI